jgi:hypothetical protein
MSIPGEKSSSSGSRRGRVYYAAVDPVLVFVEQREVTRSFLRKHCLGAKLSTAGTLELIRFGFRRDRLLFSDCYQKCFGE